MSQLLQAVNDKFCLPCRAISLKQKCWYKLT